MLEYHLYINGQFNRMFKSFKAAKITQERYDNEDWNTKLIKLEFSILGYFTTEV